jgi:hypothetical protein
VQAQVGELKVSANPRWGGKSFRLLDRRMKYADMVARVHAYERDLEDVGKSKTTRLRRPVKSARRKYPINRRFAVTSSAWSGVSASDPDSKLVTTRR